MFFRMVWKSGPIFLPFCQESRMWQTDGRTDGQTDRRTDKRTDRILIARPHLHFMQRGKNQGHFGFLSFWIFPSPWLNRQPGKKSHVSLYSRLATYKSNTYLHIKKTWSYRGPSNQLYKISSVLQSRYQSPYIQQCYHLLQWRKQSTCISKAWRT